MTTEPLEQGKKAFKQQAWGDAYSYLSASDQESPLSAQDIELLATAAYLMGKREEVYDLWTRAHNLYLTSRDVESAVRCAFWLGFILLNKGESARGGGWIARARNLVHANKLDCVEQGYLLLPLALQSLAGGDPKTSLSHFEAAGKAGDRFHDPNLVTLSRLGKGQALIRMSKVQEGVTFLDEAMANVDSGVVSPVVAGIVYCGVIETCVNIFDLNRAREWTHALSDWCASQPQLMPYRGQCLIRRSEIMQLQGEWKLAIEEARKASELLSKPKGEPASGAAFYQLGELYRLKGDFIKAEEAYNQASRWGRKPQPGLALLRLVQGQLDNAEMAITHARKEAKQLRIRSRVLPAYIEIMLRINKVKRAREAVNELIRIANDLDAPLIHAIAAQSEGSVLLAEGQTDLAVDRLQHAISIWESLEARHENARTHLLLGNAYRKTGDEDTAKMEYEAAAWTFRQLEATPEFNRVKTLISGNSTTQRLGLTPRELQVLRLIADGKANKEIAKELFISERTVERHVSNIFDKLDVSSRTAATAYAFKQQLI